MKFSFNYFLWISLNGFCFFRYISLNDFKITSTQLSSNPMSWTRPSHSFSITRACFKTETNESPFFSSFPLFFFSLDSHMPREFTPWTPPFSPGSLLYLVLLFFSACFNVFHYSILKFYNTHTYIHTYIYAN